MNSVQISSLTYSLLLLTSYLNHVGGDDGIRTHDPLLAGQVLSQLSYTPIFIRVLKTDLSKLNNDQRSNSSFKFATGLVYPCDIVSIERR